MNSDPLESGFEADRPSRPGPGRLDPGRFGAELWDRVRPTGTLADTAGWLIAWFLLLCLGAQVIWLVADNWRQDQWFAYDTNAYWLAARHLVDGRPLYTPALVWTGGAFKYPPIYAQLVVPVGWLPELLVDWAWRCTGVLCLRYLCGSWKLAVLASLQWPVFSELGFGNVTLQLGAICLWAFRDRRAAYLLPWLAGMKFGPALLIPFFWMVRPQMRRELALGCGIFAGACLASFALAPSLWWDYAGTFGWETSSQMDALWVYAIVPNHGGTDFAIRFAIGVVVTLIAIRWRLEWLAFVAATCTMPIFSLSRLAVLCGLWPLTLRGVVDRWRRNPGSLRTWIAAPLEHLDMLPRGPSGRPSAG